MIEIIADEVLDENRSMRFYMEDDTSEEVDKMTY